jgi:transposase
MAMEPIDMRHGFDSLAAWVDLNLGRKILDRDVFPFLGKRRDRIKVLWWDGDGDSLYDNSD